MVCLGNICRSPLAHGIMEHLAKENGLDWQVDSAGTGNWHVGEPPDRLSLIHICGCLRHKRGKRCYPGRTGKLSRL